MRLPGAAAAAGRPRRATAPWPPGCAFDRGMMRCAAGDYRGGLAEMAAGVAAFDALSPAERRDAPPGAWLRYPARGRPACAGYAPAVAAPWPLRAAPAASGGMPRRWPRGELALRRSGGRRAGTRGRSPAPRRRRLCPRDRPRRARAAGGGARRSFARAREAFRALGQPPVVGIVAGVVTRLVALPYQADRPGRAAALAAEARAGAGAGARACSAIRPPCSRSCPCCVLGGQLGRGPAAALAQRAWPTGYAIGLARRRSRAQQGDADAGLGAGARGAAGRARHRAGRAELFHRPGAPAPGRRAGPRRGRPARRPRLAGRPTTAGWPGAARCSAGPRGSSAGRPTTARPGDLAAARQHAERALAHATEPRQPLALLAAHRSARRTRHRRRPPCRGPGAPRRARWRWPTPAPRPTSAP